MENNDMLVRKWMSQCEYLSSFTVSKDGKLEYGIYPSTDSPRWKMNVLGEMMPDVIQEKGFVFTAKRYYTKKADYAFFTNIVKWISEQNRRGNFPRINDGIVESVVPDLTQYVSEPNRGEERCEIRITLQYKPYN